MHRFYLPPHDWPDPALTGPEAHHARSVLRLQPGDRAVVFDGHGREATVSLTSLDSSAVQFHRIDGLPEFIRHRGINPHLCVRGQRRLMRHSLGANATGTGKQQEQQGPKHDSLHRGGCSLRDIKR